MAEISRETLKKEIAVILKGADLDTLSAKKVRQQLERTLGCDLSNRKKEIDEIIMADVEQANSHSEEDVSENEQKVGEDDDDDYEPGAKKMKKPKAKKRKASDEEDDSDEEWGKKKKVVEQPSPKKPAAGGGGGRGKASAFTKSFKLSDELAAVVGADVMPRHEVVKKLWAVIKERNLQDPGNKQYAICDDQLFKVIGVKRFRTFGMMKHLKEHFLEAA